MYSLKHIMLMRNKNYIKSDSSNQQFSDVIGMINRDVR